MVKKKIIWLKTLILRHFFTFFVHLCSCTVKSCKFNDYKKIGDSTLENKENLRKTESKTRLYDL